MLTLGIETSCDETSASVTKGKRVLSNIVSSSVHLHKKYGGVVPEIASRYHVEYIVEVLSKALRRADVRLKDIGLVAVTNGPGLVGALLVGISLAKSIGYCLGLPIIGVNHILAHLYSAFLKPVRGSRRTIAHLRGVQWFAGSGGDEPKFPFIGLVVSGGHTALFLCKDAGRQALLGQTQDDAVGEAYDKVAKLLSLGYPGGPVIEKAAKRARRKTAINFPKSYLGKDSLDFSFSGIKTAVLYYVKNARQLSVDSCRLTEPLDRALVNDICYAFQEAALDVLVEKAVLAARMNKARQIVVGGGVAANSRLREKFFEAARPSGMIIHFPKFEYCMDNAAMIGVLGEELYKRGQRSDLYLTAEPNLKL